MKTSAQQEDQFLSILEDYKKLIFKIAHAYCKDAEARKDLMQEVVLQLWKAFPRYDDSYALSTWIYRIVLNVCISFYRKEKSRAKAYTGYQQQLMLLEWEETAVDPRLQQLYQLIEKLQPLDRAIMILFLEGHRNREIAEIMGMSATGVSTRMYRIRQQLSAAFESVKL